jgi:O-antigen/teichoic acid export membrane protein
MLLATPIAYKYFINEKYHSALYFVPYLCLGCFLWAINYFFYSSMLFFKEKKKILAISVFSIAASLSMNYFFIKNWKELGAAQSFCLSYALVLAATLIVNSGFVRKIFSNNLKTL